MGVTKSQFIVSALEGVGAQNPYDLLVKVQSEVREPQPESALQVSPTKAAIPRQDAGQTCCQPNRLDGLSRGQSPGASLGSRAGNGPNVNLALIDTGPMVALFDASDIAHRHYTDLLAQSDWQLTTTWPCVVEVCHF